MTNENIMKEAAMRAFEQLDEDGLELFDEMYCSPAEMDFDIFTYGHEYGKEHDYWPVVANILEGNYSKYENTVEYGKAVFKTLDEDSPWLSDHFSYNQYGAALRDALSQDEVDRLIKIGGADPDIYDKKMIDDANLAAGYLSENGGIKSLNPEILEKYFNYEAFGEGRMSLAHEEGDIIEIGKAIYDISEFDYGLGEDVKQEFINQVKNEKTHSRGNER